MIDHIGDDEIYSKLSNKLQNINGTILFPKSDGRIEVPRSIVKLLEWNNEEYIYVNRIDSTGELIINNIEDASLLPKSKIKISSGRVRIPLSTIKKARTDRGENQSVILIPNLNLSSITIIPNVKRSSEVKSILCEIGPDLCKKLFDCLYNNETALEEDDSCKPKLFLIDVKKPTIVRIIGLPFSFGAHWVTNENTGGGTLVPHFTGCSICKHRSPENMYIVPVIKKVNGQNLVGFLLAQEELKNKIASKIKGKNPSDFTLIIYFATIQDGMCHVYNNPPEQISKEELKSAQEICNNPNKFIFDTFKYDDQVGEPRRSPMLIVEKHFSIIPKNYVI